MGEDYPDRRAAAPVKPQSPRQPIYLSVRERRASSRRSRSEPEVTTFLLPRAAEPRDEDFMRNKAAPVFHSSNHVLVQTMECLYGVGDDKYQGKGCAWMAWRLVGQAQPRSCCPILGVHPPLQAWQGEASRCREAAWSRRGPCGYDGLVAANEPPAPEFSPRRVLTNYGNMTTSEFQSHLIKLDTTFRGDKALNTGKRPPNTEDKFVHLQSRALLQLRKQLQDDQLQTRACWCRAIANF